MQLEVLHKFTHNGYNYAAVFDHDSFTVSVDTDAPVPAQTVPYSSLQFAEQWIFYNICKTDRTLVQVYNSNVYPFLRVSFTPNSALCSVPSQCNIHIASVTVVDESYAGYNDGRIVINVDTSTCDIDERMYSIDGINWQRDNEFTALGPGDYIAYAKCIKVPTYVPATPVECQTFHNFDIDAGPAKPNDIYPWQEKVCKWFNLVIEDVVYPIREPIKWDAVNIIGKRDKDWHGYNYMYSDGIIELEFDCPAGKELIEAEYNSKGSDGEVFFQYGYTYQGNDFILFDGRLDLNNYKLFPGKVTAPVEKKDFNSIFQSRFDTKVALNATTTVDGVSITPPEPMETTFHYKEILRNYRLSSTEHKILDQSNFAGHFIDETVFLHLDTNGAQFNEINEHYPYTLNTKYGATPWEDDLYDWKFTFDGFFEFTISYNLDMTMQITDTNANSRNEVSNYSIRHMLRINDNSWELGPAITGTVREHHPITFPVVLTNKKFWTEVKSGDKVFLYLEVIGQTNTFFRRMQFIPIQKSISITADFLERSPNSTAKVWWLFDTVDFVVSNITNRQARLKSALLHGKGAQYARDGEASLYVTTNGKQIRKFDVNKAPLEIAMKELLNSVRAQWCVGQGFEKKGNQEYIVVERVNYFYRNKEILVIENCIDYKEEVAKEFLYNEYEFGYNKFQDEGYNTLDEFNTRHELLSPIKTNKLKLTQKSDFITSGYATEDVRRRQFSKGHNDSVSFDDDPFLFAMRRVGNTVAIEKDEPFEEIENLISPHTSYNLRLSPHRMMLNWGVWIGNTLHYKQPTEKIITTYVSHNGELTTQFSAAEENPIGDKNKRLLTEKSDCTLEDLLDDVPERIFRPDWIYFRASITPDKVQLINESLVGGRSDATNYGFITVKDHEGNYQAGFPYEVEYNYATEQMTCKMLKKWDSPVTPNEECCKYLVVNGCYLNVNGQRLIIN